MKDKQTFADLLVATNGAIAIYPDIEDRDQRDGWVKDKTREVFLKQAGLIRTLIVRTNTTPRQIVMLAQDLPYELDYLGGEIGRSFTAAVKAQQLYVAMEMWYSHTTDPAETARVQRGEAPTIEPRNDPQRREALLILSEDPWSEPVLRNWKAEITRDPEGKPSVGPWEADAFNSLSGRMTYMLPPEAYLAAGRTVPRA